MNNTNDNGSTNDNGGGPKDGAGQRSRPLRWRMSSSAATRSAAARGATTSERAGSAVRTKSRPQA